MASGRFIAYYRVSTERQGRSGLGLDAQKEAVMRHLNGGQWELVGEVVEIESGKRNDRPKLTEALVLCRVHNATLIIAKLDRLARNVAFIANLMEAGVEFVACDFPQANRLTIHVLAAVAEHEREMISKRTKEALAVAKARGAILGGRRLGALPNAAEGRAKGRAVRSEAASKRAADLLPVIEAIRASGAISLRNIALGLNERGIPTARGGHWSAVQVQRVIGRATA
ncbi:MAG: recombinase family protein [Magnetospirillum sp.]|nr:recombinase family protein [Magnetospirillum sp.]